MIPDSMIPDSFNIRRPLDVIDSIKVKLSVLIVAAVAMTVLAFQIGVTLGWPYWFRPLVAGAAALLMVQFLARGLTRPLREMAASANAMAQGDYSRRVSASSRDEVGQLAASFNAMAAELAETDRHRREFVANAAHELRTPVAALRSTLENVVDGVTLVDYDVSSKMLAKAEQLSALVNQLLDLSRLESGIRSLSPSPFDLGDLLHEVADEVQTAHPDVIVSVRSPLGLRIDGEADNLRRVFTNITSNAARYSPADGVVSLTVTRAAGDVRISVRDQGPGIPHEQRAHVFDRFWRASDGQRRGGDRPDGAGLGLSIAKQIVEQHHGTLDLVDSSPVGSCFVVCLPRDQAGAVPAPTDATLIGS